MKNSAKEFPFAVNSISKACNGFIAKIIINYEFYGKEKIKKKI